MASAAASAASASSSQAISLSDEALFVNSLSRSSSRFIIRSTTDTTYSYILRRSLLRVTDGKILYLNSYNRKFNSYYKLHDKANTDDLYLFYYSAQYHVVYRYLDIDHDKRIPRKGKKDGEAWIELFLPSSISSSYAHPFYCDDGFNQFSIYLDSEDEIYVFDTTDILKYSPYLLKQYGIRANTLDSGNDYNSSDGTDINLLSYNYYGEVQPISEYLSNTEDLYMRGNHYIFVDLREGYNREEHELLVEDKQVTIHNMQFKINCFLDYL